MQQEVSVCAISQGHEHLVSFMTKNDEKMAVSFMSRMNIMNIMNIICIGAGKVPRLPPYSR